MSDHDLEPSSVAADGLPLEELFARHAGTGLTFDDLIVLPRFVSEVPTQVDLRSELTPGIRTLPILSSPMDRVTEWRTAVHMALNGCLGFLHINLSPEEAAEQVRRVKRFQMGFIWKPFVAPPGFTVADARRVKAEHGFSTIPITEDGTRHSRLIGLVTKNCIDLEDDPNRPLHELMIPFNQHLRVAYEYEVRNLAQAREIFRQDPQLAKLPILNRDGSLYALVNRGDVRNRKYPDAAIDDNNQLRVGAAVTTHPDDDERMNLLLEAGVDCLMIDSSQGGTGYMLERIAKIKAAAAIKKRTVGIIAGNTATIAQAAPLVSAGAHCIRVGMGPGSICTTQGALRIGRAQGSAVFHTAGNCIMPIIADGGIRSTGDMFLALALGARFVMIGRYMAGCEESPSPTVTYNNQRYKLYRGMGSISAMKARSGGRYGRSQETLMVAQGTDDQLVPFAGSLDKLLAETVAALKVALAQVGCASVADLHRAVSRGDIRFERRSPAAQTEGGLHDLIKMPGSLVP